MHPPAKLITLILLILSILYSTFVNAFTSVKRPPRWAVDPDSISTPATYVASTMDSASHPWMTLWMMITLIPVVAVWILLCVCIYYVGLENTLSITRRLIGLLARACYAYISAFTAVFVQATPEQQVEEGHEQALNEGIDSEVQSLSESVCNLVYVTHAEQSECAPRQELLGDSTTVE